MVKSSKKFVVVSILNYVAMRGLWKLRNSLHFQNASFKHVD